MRICASYDEVQYDFMRLWKSTPGTTYRDSTALLSRIKSYPWYCLMKPSRTDTRQEPIVVGPLRRMERPTGRREAAGAWRDLPSGRLWSALGQQPRSAAC